MQAQIARLAWTRPTIDGMGGSLEMMRRIAALAAGGSCGPAGREELNLLFDKLKSGAALPGIRMSGITAYANSLE